MLRTPLYDRHLALGARLLPFAGWEMPIQYQGIVTEHRAVRSAVGTFDISHMGQLEVSGEEATSWLNALLSNDLAALKVGEGQYTLLLNEAGGVIDDLIVYRTGEQHYFLVVNASRVDADHRWLQSHLGPARVALHDRSSLYGAVAVQGPESVSIWNRLVSSEPLPPRNHLREMDGGVKLCRTGYTGEEGFELFAPVDEIGAWFDRFLDAGAVPCGLGARDTLRLEKAYPLYGNDLDESHSALEAGLGFFVKLDKPGGFLGREALAAQKAAGLPTRLCALRLADKAPPLRHGYAVLPPEGGEPIGELSSGTLSPSLGCGIGLAYLPVEWSRIGTELLVSIRERTFPALVVKKPFL